MSQTNKFPSEIVELDAKINVVILDFDEDKSRIQLGLKQLSKHPWEALSEDVKVGDKVSKGSLLAKLDGGEPVVNPKKKYPELEEKTTKKNGLIDFSTKQNEIKKLKTKNYFTFGCFNNFQKINPETIKLWSRILKETNSRLVLKTSMYPSKDLNEHTLNLFLEEGVNVDQVQILKRTKTIKEHLQLYNSIDLSLDTHPYPGVTTSFESIWMGVPVLTLRGFNFLSRCGESININLGLKNFICNDDDDFVNKAILLTKNLNYLNDLRINLRELAKKSHLFNSKNFAKDSSLNLKKTWNKYLENSI